MKVLQIQVSEEDIDLGGQGMSTADIIAIGKQGKSAAGIIAIGEQGKSAAARLSAELEIPCLSGVSEIRPVGDRLEVSYDAYQANVKIRQEVPLPVLLVLKPEAEDALDAADIFEIEKCRIAPESCGNTEVFTEKKEEVSGNFEQDTIFVIGHGAGSKENAQEICAFALKYGFGVGATRPVVTDGWVASRYLLGISGSVIAPRVCIVLGASGSQAFMAGIGNSEIIFSVNTDEHAMIYEKSDYGLVMDCMQFIRKLDAKWRKSSGE
ncbi:MAG: electron transfer flavoprotein subunit alpha/FixB family protein [Eubacterium sp.]|nr:electron transfer flavoprotein subunit alpha/FixB family protein [Eubacterium sp.]